MFTVIIVDDNKITAEMIAHSLDWEAFGCQVKAVEHNGQRGKTAIARIKPDIVITDIYMHGSDGLEMVELTQSLIPYAKIIFITAHDNFKYAYKAIKLRAFDYLLKPFSKNDLSLIVSKAVSELNADIKRLSEANDTAPRPYAEEFLDCPLLAKKILRYIEDNISKPISLKLISEHFDISVSHVGSLIKKHTGKHYLEYVTGVKMRHARTLLMNPRYRMEEIAGMIGYKNYVTFYKMFVKCEGVSPTVFRNKAVKRAGEDGL